MKYQTLTALTLLVLLGGCSKANENIAKVKQDSLKNFIYLQGGTFTMGDFGLDKTSNLKALVNERFFLLMNIII